jgi:hypothetical protein
VIALADIARDARLCFEEAARRAFPDGTVTAATLRAAARAGKLPFTCGGKRYYPACTR